MTHTHDIEVECADSTDRVTVSGADDCIWCDSTAEDRARVVFVSPSSLDLATVE